MLKTIPNNVTEYIENRSHKKWSLECNDVRGIESVIVVPAICEFENIKKLLTSLSQNSESELQKSLVIFVINNSVSASLEVKKDNKFSVEFLRESIRKNILESGIRIGLIDAATEGYELEDSIAGVGVARKIGMDAALKVFDYSLPNNKIIISLDADCSVEQNYLAEIHRFFNRKNASIAIVDFEHPLPENQLIKLGIFSYEIFLRHYVAGLLYANSPFAFHTVGSTIICDHEAYIKIGGMNTKKAAEDFYFLEKLAKQYNVFRITTTKVKPSSRESWRVPFGTGKSMTDYASGKKDILVNDPETYLILKEWLTIFNSEISTSPERLINEAKIIHTELYNFLESRKFRKSWEKILDNSKTSVQLDYQRINWFDAFETLKLIHHLRDTSFPMMDIETGVEKLFKLVNYSAKLDTLKSKDSKEVLFAFYLSELKTLENKLYQTHYS